MTQSGFTGAQITIIVVVIGVAGLIIAVALINSSINKKDSGSQGGTTTSPPVQFAVQVPNLPNNASSTKIEINNSAVGYVYTHQEPHKITIGNFPVGDYPYRLETTYQTESANNTITGAGNILVAKDKVYEVRHTGSKVYLELAK